MVVVLEGISEGTGKQAYWILESIMLIVASTMACFNMPGPKPRFRNLVLLASGTYVEIRIASFESNSLPSQNIS